MVNVKHTEKLSARKRTSGWKRNVAGSQMPHKVTGPLLWCGFLSGSGLQHCENLFLEQWLLPRTKLCSSQINANSILIAIYRLLMELCPSETSW